MRLYHHYHIWQGNVCASGVTRYCRGVSLVTVLVSLVLSLFLLTASVYWYQILKKTLIADKKKRQELDIGRTTLHFMGQDLNACGYRGCRTRDNNFAIRRAVVDFRSAYRFIRTDRLVTGFFSAPGVCPLYLPVKACERLKEDSDVLIIYNVPKKRGRLKNTLLQEDEVIVTEENSGIQTGSVVLLSDCLQGDLFVATLLDREKIYHTRSPSTNITPKFSKCYFKHSEVTELQTVAYYLGKPKRARHLNTPYFSLYRDDIVHQAVEVIEGITHLEIRYGVSVPGIPMQYYKADSIPKEGWGKIRGVQIKIITEKEEWQYEVALRNWPYTH